MERTNTVYSFPNAYLCHINSGVETVLLRKTAYLWSYFGALPSGFVSSANSKASVANFCNFLRTSNNTPIPFASMLWFYAPLATNFPEEFIPLSPVGLAHVDLSQMVNAAQLLHDYGSTGYRLYLDSQDKSFWMDIEITGHLNSWQGPYYEIKFILGSTREIGKTIHCECKCGTYSQYTGGSGNNRWGACVHYFTGIPFIGSYLASSNYDTFSFNFAECYGTYGTYIVGSGNLPENIDYTWNYLAGNGGDWWSNSNTQEYLDKWLGNYAPHEPDFENPYDGGGSSGEGGGGGNFSDESDDVDVDTIPTIDAVGTGFATLFNPTKSQLKSLSDVMWDSNIFTALQNLVENIQNMFTSLAIVPFTIDKGATVEVTWLGLNITNVFLDLCSNQYYEFDMGSINMATDSRIFTSGSALDYSPYSKLGIFLPFIGYQDLDIDECRDAVIGLKYRIDILSGTCVALISINGNTIYQFTGNCLSQIPITNENMQSLVSDAVNVGIAAAATHSAMGAASADMAAAEGSTKMSEAAKEAKVAHAQAHVSSSAGQLSSATANAAMGMKPSYGKAGAISASASLLAVKQPYLFLTTPRQSMPSHYQRYCGFPSNITGKLNTFSGFTVVEDIRLNGLVATSPEVSEIYELLKKGVII